MAEKKRPTLWFEEPVDDIKRSQDSFFENIEKMFSQPSQASVIKFPSFRTSFIPVKMGQTERDLVLRAEIPGFRKENIRLKVTPKLVYISAEKKDAKTDKGDNFMVHQSSSSSANRILELPMPIITEGVKARYKDGFLEVVMKKKDPKKEKDVKVE
jgi:HSP20 family protein